MDYLYDCFKSFFSERWNEEYGYHKCHNNCKDISGSTCEESWQLAHYPEYLDLYSEMIGKQEFGSEVIMIDLPFGSPYPLGREVIENRRLSYPKKFRR